MPKLDRVIDLIKSSAKRLARAINLPEGPNRKHFLRKEAWIHFKLSSRLLWYLYLPNLRGRRRR